MIDEVDKRINNKNIDIYEHTIILIYTKSNI